MGSRVPLLDSAPPLSLALMYNCVVWNGLWVPPCTLLRVMSDRSCAVNAWVLHICDICTNHYNACICTYLRGFVQITTIHGILHIWVPPRHPLLQYMYLFDSIDIRTNTQWIHVSSHIFDVLRHCHNLQYMYFKYSYDIPLYDGNPDESLGGGLGGRWDPTLDASLPLGWLLHKIFFIHFLFVTPSLWFVLFSPFLWVQTVQTNKFSTD